MSTNITSSAITSDTKDDAITKKTYNMLLKWINFSDSHYKVWEKRKNCGHFFGGSYWYGIGTSFTAFVYAVVSKYGEFDGKICNTTRDEIKKKAIGAIRYLGFTHDTGPADCVRERSDNPHTNNRKWGGKGDDFFKESQHGTPISRFGIAAWILWDDLDDETKGLVRNVLEDYANKWIDYPCPSGTYTDTQTEENAWTAMGIAVAYFVLKEHPNRKKWEKAMKRWSLNTCATYLDAYKQKPVRAVTTHPDYTTENHKFVHPNYLGSGISIRGIIALLCKMTKTSVPDEVKHGWKDVYNKAIKVWCDADGTPIPIQGQDWWYYSLPSTHLIHTVMNVINNNSDAAYFEKKALDRIQKIQSSNYNGCFYEEDGKRFVINRFQSAFEMEHGAAASLAFTYLFHKFTNNEEKSCHRKDTGVYHYPYGNTVINRTENSFACFSYRNNCMAFCLPKNGMWSFTPYSANMIGKMDIEEFNGDPGVSNLNIVRNVDKFNIIENKDYFSANVKIDRGLGLVDQYVGYIAMPDGKCIYSHYFKANKDITVNNLNAGIMGIRNENYKNSSDVAKGYRKFYTQNGVKKYEGYMGGEDIIDVFDNTSYVNIDNEMGIITLYNKKIKYINKHNYPKWVGLEDILILDSNDKGKKVEKQSNFGNLLSVQLPNVTYEQGKNIYDNIKVWNTSNTGINVLTLDNKLCYINNNNKDEFIKAKRQIKKDKFIPIYPGLSVVNGQIMNWQKKVKPMTGDFHKPVCKIKGLTDGITLNYNDVGFLNVLNTANENATINIKNHSGDIINIELKPNEFYIYK